jgi:excisionase family DNA binding protein
MKTAAEQLAEALQRVIDETVDRALNGHQADVDLHLAAAGKVLGFSSSYVLRLCKRGELDSVGTGHRRRVPMSAIVAFKKRFRNAGRRAPVTDLREGMSSTH